MKKILLIPALNVVSKKIEPYMPMGLLSLQAIAADYQNEIDILDFNQDLLSKIFENSEDLAQAIFEKIKLDDYDTIGFSCKCNSFHHAIRIAQLIKKHRPEIQICMGGPHATAVAEKILARFPEIDAIFMGESENMIKEVLLRRSKGDTKLNGLPGVMTLNNEYCPQKLLGNLDELPDLQKAKDFYKFVDTLPTKTILNGKEVDMPLVIPLEAARGCPNKCTFCSTNLFWGTTIRYKSEQRLISEMKTYNEKTGCRYFAFIGDNFASNKKKFIGFCNYLIENNYDFDWMCNIRLNLFNKEDLDILWKSGCRKFFVGVESASTDTLKKIKKNIKLKEELELIKLAINMGFSVETALIVGFPWETKEDINDTLELHKSFLEWGVDRSDIRVLCPLPGTELTREYEVGFDNIKSDIARDDLPIDENFENEIIKKNKDIFIHLGYYKTPNLTRFDIIKLEYDSSRAKLEYIKKKLNNPD